MRVATVARAHSLETVAAVQCSAGFVGIDRINRLSGSSFATSLLEIVQAGDLPLLASHLHGLALRELTDGAADVEVRAPWTRPPKIIGIGLNYADHAHDLGARVPVEPASFLRPSTAVGGPGEPIRLPRRSARVTAEAELGLVIGHRCRNVNPDEARDVVAGFVSIIDVTAEDILQRNPRFLTRAKSFDSFFRWGPVLITPDEISDLGQLSVRTIVNDSVVAEGQVANMTFSPDELVSFFSHEMTLEPGDVFSTGTPGAAVIVPGDRVQCEISGFPPLEAPVVADAE
jgi:2-keto-4-pentenoate hydratase/2-oxohepta-3-ene-1,7-dioic acid hydratase in catechol pathway